LTDVVGGLGGDEGEEEGRQEEELHFDWVCGSSEMENEDYAVVRVMDLCHCLTYIILEYLLNNVLLNMYLEVNKYEELYQRFSF